MPYLTFTTLTAECGHEYEGYTNQTRWRYCSDCVRAVRLAMRADNERRALVLANAEPSRSYKPSRAKRLRIYERDGWVCQLCFVPVDPLLDSSDNMAASLDHIICRSWGGGNGDSNLRLAHRICNSRRGDEGRWITLSRRHQG